MTTLSMAMATARTQEPNAPVATCPACNGAIYHKQQVGAIGLICSQCMTTYRDLAEVNDLAEWLQWAALGDEQDDIQRAEDESGYSDIVAAGLERWQR